MRILHLTRDFPPHSAGGTSTAVGSLVTALRGRSIPTCTISFDHWRGRAGDREVVDTNPDDGVALRISKGRPWATVAAAANAFEPTLLHLHHENLWPFAEMLRAELGIPIVYSVHTLQQPGDDRSARSHSSEDQKSALGKADVVAVPSRFAAREIAPLLAATTPLEIVPNIVAPPSTEGTSTTPPTNAASPIATYVGRFDYSKGTDTLFDIVRSVLQRDPSLRFEIAGGLPASGKRERRWLRRWESDAPPHATCRVSFPGWLGGAQLEELYARSAVQVVPSRSETFGLSAAEAMARGIAVVATHCGALPELIAHGETGVLCEDAADIAAHVLRLAGDSSEARRLGQNAAQSIERRFSANAVLPTWLEVYGHTAAARTATERSA